MLDAVVESALVGDESAPCPQPVRGGLGDSIGSSDEAGWQKNPSTNEWHYLRAGESRSVCGLWRRDRRLPIDSRQPELGVCEMCLSVVGV